MKPRVVERLPVGLLAGSVDEFSGKAVASLPEVALGAPWAFVIDTLLMRATDDAIRHNDGECAMRFDVFQDLLRDLGVGANVAGLKLPRAHLRHFGGFVWHDANRHFTRSVEVRALERDSRTGHPRMPFLAFLRSRFKNRSCIVIHPG